MNPESLLSLLSLLDPALRGALLALLLLLAANLLRFAHRAPLEQTGLALTFGLSVQVLASAPAVELGPLAWWRAPLVGVSMGNSVLFWLFARTLCDDDFRIEPRHRAAWAAVVAAGTLNLALMVPWCAAGGPGWASAISQTVFGLPLVFGLLAVRVAARHWRDDLVERRRWLRAFIVVGGCAYTLGMLLARRSTADGRLTPSLAAVDAAALLFIVAAAAWMQLRPTRGDLVAPLATAESPEQSAPTDIQGMDAEAPTAALPDPAEDALAVALAHAMGPGRAYKDPELSLAALAAKLSVPEYRLRRLINRRLGHRNFNAFLNGFRLAEAQAALANPQQAHLPVLSIALEAGFGSIGPFNRAFKATTGLTPTEFRRQNLADS
ncbi:DNA-binding domain-containing protein, AraC-type [Burkholderiales bacterium JOSHI_001]|nr:DNA-binding domain-containing protein, AraC-type [Burkholderiales bacterium JOSHI_001]